MFPPGAPGCEVKSSLWATRPLMDIHGYIDTARKHGQDVPTALRAAMTVTRWSPRPGHHADLTGIKIIRCGFPHPAYR